MIDKVVIYVKAGDGGDGVVSFRREKFVPRGGPDGGNGGDGGSIILQSDTQINTLRYFGERQKFVAEDGGRGAGRKRQGKDGGDIILRVPVGTVVYEVITYNFTPEGGRAKLTAQNLDKQEKKLLMDLDNSGMDFVIAKGGKGGFGNAHYKSSVNQTPREADSGERGEEKWLVLELKLLADVGLVGLPNAGKSTLLSVLTKAKPKIADYPFTTLEPNLGVMIERRVLPRVFPQEYPQGVPSWGSPDTRHPSSLVIADIPGLIEGASKGRGLGDEFLRHIERCKMLVHLIALRLEDNNLELKASDGIAKQLYKDYQVVREELVDYDPGLGEKSEVVVISKIDLADKKLRDKIKKYFQKKKIPVLMVSAVTLEGIGGLKKEIFKKD